MSTKTILCAQLCATADPIADLTAVISDAKTSHINFSIKEEPEEYSVVISFHAVYADGGSDKQNNVCHINLLSAQSISAATEQIKKYHFDQFNAVGGEYAVLGLCGMLRYATGISESEPDEWNVHLAHLILSDYHSDDDVNLICSLLHTLNVQYNNYITFDNVVSKYGRFTILFTLSNGRNGKLSFSIVNAKQINAALLSLYDLVDEVEQIEMRDSTFKRNRNALVSVIK